MDFFLSATDFFPVCHCFYPYSRLSDPWCYLHTLCVLADFFPVYYKYTATATEGASMSQHLSSVVRFLHSRVTCISCGHFRDVFKTQLFMQA